MSAKQAGARDFGHWLHEVPAMRIVTASEMQAIDRAAGGQYGISSLQLMEQAGASLARRAQKLLPFENAQVVVLAGSGKNGGDGLVCARHLAAAGVEVLIMFFGGRQPAQETRRQLKRLPSSRITLLKAGKTFSQNWSAHFSAADLAIDALLGIGLSGPPREPMAGAIRALNASGIMVLAADVPSGLDADSGQALQPAVKAFLTLTFGAPKQGLLQPKAAEFVGRLEVDPIGFPWELLSGSGEGEMYFSRQEAERLLPQRPATAHKRSAGRVLIVGGSAQYHGAPLLAAAGAARMGAGYVTVAYPEVLDGVLRTKLLEEICLPLPAGPGGNFSRSALRQMLNAATDCDSVVIGPGLGRPAVILKIVCEFLQRVSGPRTVVVDADALAALQGCQATPAKDGPAWVLTPHAGEAAALLKVSSQSVDADRWAAARELAQRYQAVVVLKGRHSLVAGPSSPVFVVGSGTQALAVAGTGDVLAGMIAALSAQNLAAAEAAALGVYLHGLAGELACPDPGGLGLRAREVADYVPEAIRRLRLHVRS